jgi:very-short-patch-repair endonuclease
MIESFSAIKSSFYLAQHLNVVINADMDFSVLKCNIMWCSEFARLISVHKLGKRFVTSVCDKSSDALEQLEQSIVELNIWKNNTTDLFEKFANLFGGDTKDVLYYMPLTKLIAHINECKENFVGLEYLIDYHIACRRMKELGIDAYLDDAKSIKLSAVEIIPVFKKCFFRSWLDSVIPKLQAISEFRRLRQDEKVALFKELDKSHIKISNAIVISKLISRLPNFDAFSAGGEIALLQRERTKKRKLMPTRLLIASLPNLLPALKPCVMMSPLSVSTYLGSSNFEFDTVIFDEASQIRTEEAIGAIFRAKQAIIVGDSKQLPPTDFFGSSMSTSDEYEENEDGEADDSGAFESLLDEAVMLPSQTLLWHYRSRHEHLIAFSNAKIYESNLITFPSSVEKASGMGVEYIHVKGGTYDRGGKNGNRLEAEKVADLVFEHFKTHPKRSLGIIAFGNVQQTAIQDAIESKRHANPLFETYFNDDNDESLFVKNLETVQGDERDTIIFSIGFAPDATGKFLMNFGPLNRDGGERRLNVAVTRARYNLKLVGSILPTDIAVDRISGQGPKLLRSYIDFAINGINTIIGELTVDNDIWFDSPFEESVHEFLTMKGYDVSTQVGCSGYRIDMAVKHPTINGIYTLGIECDGATYHSARTARERDRLRQDVLESMGWRIYRIWSTDWIKDKFSEGSKLIAAIEDSIFNYGTIENTTENNALDSSVDEFVSIDKKEVSFADKGNPYGFESAIHTSFSNLPRDSRGYVDITDCIMALVNDQFPLHYELMCQRLASLHGKERATSTVRKNVDYGLRRLGDKLIRKGDFLFPAERSEIIVRIPNERKIDHISLEEIGVAMCQILNRCIGINRDELCSETAKVYFGRTGKNIAIAMDEACGLLISRGMVKEVDGKLSVNDRVTLSD